MVAIETKQDYSDSCRRKNIFVAGAMVLHFVLQEDRGQMLNQEDAAQRDLWLSYRSQAVWSKKQRNS